MIYVNQKQLDQVEYLIEQSCRGHHVLFDADIIRAAFGAAEEESLETETTEKHIENLILQPTLVSKRAYLENLTIETRDRVVRTYFSIVENNLFEALEFSQ
ncbi:MAG: hypothetical protein HY074_03790 [Deltaproteobacteria bacterium]|nr:hypothetical protein [Deltaproteobacteria bacterium]